MLVLKRSLEQVLIGEATEATKLTLEINEVIDELLYPMLLEILLIAMAWLLSAY